MGLSTVDVGSVPTLRKFVNNCLEKRGYRKLRGYKPFKQLQAIKLKVNNFKNYEDTNELDSFSA